ncbi:MAG: DUF3090 family protein [Chloroflexi bacterium]|nr:DUF3090 family protein [Chloroflexota bacterium]
MEERYEFDEATLLSALAIGAPGKRTFFLIIGQKEKWLRAWLEKNLLESLALAIDQFLFTLSREFPSFSRRAAGTPSAENLPSGLPAAELETEEITLGFDREKATLNLSAHASGPQRERRVEVYCRVTLSQLEKLGDQAKSVCAAGRPRCVLCGGPIDPSGHICPKSN